VATGDHADVRGVLTAVSVSYLVALWVSILQTVAGLPASRPQVAFAPPAHAAAESRVLRSDSHPAPDAPRAARVVAGVVSATIAAPATHPTPPASPASPARPLGDALGATDARPTALCASHAVAARGAVLPYFATAPPLQG
jgi:hypothetical protein